MTSVRVKPLNSDKYLIDSINLRISEIQNVNKGILAYLYIYAVEKSPHLSETIRSPTTHRHLHAAKWSHPPSTHVYQRLRHNWPKRLPTSSSSLPSSSSTSHYPRSLLSISSSKPLKPSLQITNSQPCPSHPVNHPSPHFQRAKTTDPKANLMNSRRRKTRRRALRRTMRTLPHPRERRSSRLRPQPMVDIRAEIR